MEPALARPGGRISSGRFSSGHGHDGGGLGVWVVLGLFMLFSLFMLLHARYVTTQRNAAESRTLKDLRQLVRHHKLFNWRKLENHIEFCFQKVHLAWSQGNLAEVSKYMTNKYRQEQQSDYLDKWAKKGLINHCEVTTITLIQPLFLAHPEQEMEGSKLVVAITANMEDYLEERYTGQIVKGEQGFKDVDTIWTFVVQNGKWVLANIEDSSFFLYYARAQNELPVNLEQKKLNLKIRPARRQIPRRSL